MQTLAEIRRTLDAADEALRCLITQYDATDALSLESAVNRLASLSNTCASQLRWEKELEKDD